MVSDCIFCKIASGDIPCTKVYEDDLLLGFLDIAPISPGHSLLIPKAHYPTLLELPDSLGAHLLPALTTLSKAVIAATKADGLNLLMNTNRAAGQLVDHAHFHLIPRHENDGLKHWPQSSYASPEDMNDLAEAIRKQLA